MISLRNLVIIILLLYYTARSFFLNEVHLNANQNFSPTFHTAWSMIWFPTRRTYILVASALFSAQLIWISLCFSLVMATVTTTTKAWLGFAYLWVILHDSLLSVKHLPYFFCCYYWQFSTLNCRLNHGLTDRP